jgi:sugar phosphate isomerase/epimerase
MGESPSAVYDLVGTRLVLVQVNEARRIDPEGDAWQLVLLGEGEVPVRGMLAVVARAGYSGAASVEWERRWYPELAEAGVALRQHIQVVSAWPRDVDDPRERA